MGGNRWTGISCDTSGRVTGINLFNLNLRGNLPREIGYLTGLSSLDLHMNSFTGMVPTDLGLLQNLQYIALSDNSFAGTIPSQLGTLPNLQSLYLFGNKFTGTLPSSLCSGTQQLQKFFPCNGIGSAKCRDLTGCAPSCLSNVTRYNIGILNFCSTMPTNSPTAAPT